MSAMVGRALSAMGGRVTSHDRNRAMSAEEGRVTSTDGDYVMLLDVDIAT